MRKSCLLAVMLLALPLAAFAQADILSLKNRIIDLQNAAGLAVSEFAFCSKILGFGSYVPLDSSTVNRGAELRVYYEPLNVFTNRVNGQYEIWYTQDVVLLSARGDELYRNEGMLNFHYTSRKPVFDLYGTNSLTLGNLPAGKYVYKIILHDKLKDATAEFSAPFTIAE